MNAFISWILGNWPLLGVGLVVIAASCVTSWKISRFTKRVEESMDKVDRLGGESESHSKKLEALPCADNAAVMRSLAEEVSSRWERSEAMFEEVSRSLAEESKRREEQHKAAMDEISRNLATVERTLDGKVQAHGAEQRKRVEELPCQSHSRSIERLQGKEELVDDINERLESVAKWVMRHDDSMIDSLSRKCSPRRLTEAGKELYSISGGKRLLEENMDYLISEMEKRAPGTPYDVEDCALSVLLSSTAKPMFNGIKNYIYNAPDKLDLPDGKGGSVKVSLSLYSVVWVMSIELRDEYLKAHSEIK